MTAAEFARQKFPHLSDALIEQNEIEIIFVMNGQRECAACFSLEMCDTLLNTAGYTPVMELTPAGHIKATMAACRHNPSGVKPKPSKVILSPNAQPCVIQDIFAGQEDRRYP